MKFAAIISIWILLKFSKVIPLLIAKVSSFPHPLHKSFDISLNFSNESLKINDTLVIRITDKLGNNLEEAAFDYGMKNEIEDTYSGEFMIISKWKKNPTINAILASLFFNKRSDNQYIEIHKIQLNSDDAQNQLPDKFEDSQFVYHSKIKLIYPTKLKLKVSNAKGKVNGFHEGEIGIASCKLYGGTQNSLPVFINIKHFTIKRSSLSLEKKERKFEFIVSLADHMKEIVCKSGENIQKAKVKVFHPPNKVKLEPELKAKFVNDTKVSCSYLNGYPFPVTQWRFIKGPAKANSMYKITQGGKYLKITVGKLDNSIWSFNCTARNNIADSVRWFNKTFSFVIMENTSNKKINLKSNRPIKEQKISANYNELLGIKKAIQIMIENYSKLTEITDHLKRDHKNFSAALKETEKTNAGQNREIFELKSNCQSCSIKTKKLKSANKYNRFESEIKRKDDSIEIKNLRESLEVLKMKINEITDRINKFPLGPPTVKPQQMKQIQTQTPLKTRGYPPFGMTPSNEWRINKIQQKRKKAFPIFGNFFYADYNANKMKMLFFPNGYETFSGTHLTVILQLIFSPSDESYKPFQGDILMGIYNSRNQYLNKIILRNFLLTREVDRAIFNFNYDELRVSGVLTSDEIIIKCFVNLKYESF